jgi:N-acyl-D-amino-acid deacylase
MTSFPAQRIGLTEIGRISEGYWADLVLFDPGSIADNTTFQQPDAPPSGIRDVLISGKIVAHDGQLVSTERFGRVLRRW